MLLPPISSSAKAPWKTFSSVYLSPSILPKLWAPFCSFPDFPQAFPVLSFICGVNPPYSEPTAHFAHSNRRPLCWLLPPWKYNVVIASDFQNMPTWPVFPSLEVYPGILLNDTLSLHLDMQSVWNNANFLHELFLCPISWSLMDNSCYYAPE